MTQPQAPTPDPVDPVKAANQAKGAQLVRLSRWLLLSGVLVGITGCGVGFALRTFNLGILCAGLGFAIIVGAAVIGQVGRGLQGRVV